MHATGYKTAPNVGVYNGRFYEGRYLNGVMAGRMTKTNVAGIVAAFPIPEVVMGINAFTRGMRSVNPKAKVRVIWTNSWFDPGQGARGRPDPHHPGRRHAHPRHRFHRRDPGRGGEGREACSATTPTRSSTAPTPSSRAPCTSGATSTSRP